MANTFITPAWVTKDALDAFRNGQQRALETWTSPLNAAMSPLTDDFIPMPVPATPVDGRVVLALGAAAVIANPEPISRRALFGLAWIRKG
jgi:hypothetical protein